MSYDLGMAETNTVSEAPSFQMRHRLALALEVAGVRKDDMADYIGVSRQTVDNYLSGRTEPTIGYVRNWATKCQVSVSWLLTGSADTGTVTREYLVDNTYVVAA